SPHARPAALEPIPRASSEPAPDTARIGAGAPYSGRALLLPATPTPATAPDLARRAADAARDVSGVELDYTPASLELVDAILDGFREPGSDLMAETTFAFGCYLGEV